MSIAYSSDCPCINSTPALLSSALVKCSTERGLPGVVNKQGICYPVTYGSNICKAYDNDVDPRCLSDNPPAYCSQSWCYVDTDLCRKSEEQYFLSDILDEDLYYSYTTCGSSHDLWQDDFSTIALEGLNLTVTIPNLYYPYHYKNSKVVVKRSDEYYDDSIPWRGWMVDYFDKVVELSNINSVTYIHQSKWSEKKSESMWTQSVYDVNAGISSMALSSFWITAERLRHVMYTVPLRNEELFLFAESPQRGEQDDDGYLQNMYKTLRPFQMSVWIFLPFVFVIVGWLKIAFSMRESPDGYWHQLRNDNWKKASYQERSRILLKMCFESVLFESTHALGSSIDVTHDDGISLKLLSAGFAFFLLFLITSYTANLAACLTLSIVKDSEYPKSIDDAINVGWKICSYPGIGQELEQKFHPESFVYFEGVDEHLKAYRNGTCQGIILPLTDFRQNEDTMRDFCDVNLVKIGPPVLQKYIGLPVSSNIAAGLSFWIDEAKEQDISFMKYEEEYQLPPPPGCSFEITDNNNSQTHRIRLKDFALPITYMFFFIGIAVLNHTWNWKYAGKGKDLKSGVMEMSNRSLPPKDKNEDEIGELHRILDEMKHKLGQISK